jgi:hypothetical protein
MLRFTRVLTPFVGLQGCSSSFFAPTDLACEVSTGSCMGSFVSSTMLQGTGSCSICQGGTTNLVSQAWATI